MSCSDCLFKSVFQDMGASVNVCRLQNNLLDAINFYGKSTDCPYRLTLAEAKIFVLDRQSIQHHPPT